MHAETRCICTNWNCRKSRKFYFSRVKVDDDSPMTWRHAMTSEAARGLWEIYDVTWLDIRLSAIRLMSIDQCQSGTWGVRSERGRGRMAAAEAAVSIRRFLWDFIEWPCACICPCLPPCSSVRAPVLFYIWS